MKYEDGPTAEVETLIDADPSVVWALVSDITTPVRFSSELQEVHRIDRRWVRLAMPNAAPRAHSLPIARQNHGTGAKAVFVLELP